MNLFSRLAVPLAVLTLSDLHAQGDSRTSIIAQRQEQIAEKVTGGRMSALEGEFLTLLTQEFSDPGSRQEAIRAWQVEKGAALKAEHDEKRALTRPLREADRTKVSQQRRQHIAAEYADGRISALEAEFRTLLTSNEASPEARHLAIRTWQAEKGDALKAERETQRVADLPEKSAARAEDFARRQQHIAEEVANGRIGPLEAEFLGIFHGNNGDPRARQEGIRAWLAEHGQAYRAEREARRDSLSSQPASPEKK